MGGLQGTVVQHCCLILAALSLASCQPQALMQRTGEQTYPPTPRNRPLYVYDAANTGARQNIKITQGLKPLQVLLKQHPIRESSPDGFIEIGQFEMDRRVGYARNPRSDIDHLKIRWVQYIPELKEQARRMGGHALLIKSAGAYPVRFGTGTNTNAAIHITVSGSVIRWNE